MLQSKFHPSRDYTLAAVAALVFAWLAITVPTAGPAALDVTWRAIVHSFACPPLTAVMKAVTQLGGGWFLFPLGALIAGSLHAANRRNDAALFVLAVLGANILNESMKLVFHRTRPTAWFDYPEPSSYSFPSGHSFVSFCFYLSLAEILMRDEWPLSRKAAIWTAAGLLALAIGLSRVYLGVHYPTDVIAGFAAATVWTTMVRIGHHTFLGKSPPARVTL